jgi:hypothetical protein
MLDGVEPDWAATGSQAHGAAGAASMFGPKWQVEVAPAPMQRERRLASWAAPPTRRTWRMLELGRAQRTILVARHLRLRDVQREVEEALNVVESWNRVNTVMAFGNGGGLRDRQPSSLRDGRAVPAHPAQPPSCTSTRSCSKTCSPRPRGPSPHRAQPTRPHPPVLGPHTSLGRSQIRRRLEVYAGGAPPVGCPLVRAVTATTERCE